MRAATLEPPGRTGGVQILLHRVSPTTTPSPNPFSEQWRINLITPENHTPPKIRHIRFAAFVALLNHQQEHRDIKLVTPDQSHDGDAVEIWRYRAVVYEEARQRHQSR